jgi:hypothetical protein
MNHWQLCYEFIGKTIEVYRGRLVKITGCATPGNAFCEAVDGGTPIYEVSTAFLQAGSLR